MTFEQFEKFIAESLSSLPRKPVPAGRKEDVWLCVQNHIRQTRKDYEQLSRHSGFFVFLRSSRLAVTALTVVIAISLLGGAAEASKGSLPGDTLYTVKKAVEQVQVAVATVQGQEKKVTTLKNHAKTRLQEVSTLVTEKTATKEEVEKSLVSLKTATDKVVAASAEKPELLTHAVELAKEEKTTLDEVESSAEGDVKIAVQSAITESKESLEKIISQEKVEGEEEVKGEAAATPTSTPPVVAKPTKTQTTPIHPTDEKGKVESGVQIQGIINGDSGFLNDDSGDDPTILPEPNFKF